jgi:CheY-like chemotaxis protein
VDDDAATRAAVAELLEMEGHHVHVAATGALGIALILEHRPHASLIDVGMAEMDGLEVARRVRAHPAGLGLRLIALTGYDRREDRDRARAAGFDAHAVKPIDAATLLRLVDG